MITVKLWGGMCNQMFQYAFGYALSKEKNDNLVFDVDFYSNQPKHVGKRKIISMEQFPLIGELETAKRSLIIQFLENKYISHLIRYNTGCDFQLGNLHILVERLHRHYSFVPYNESTNNYYDGYWQSANYFKYYEQDIRKIFTPSNIILDAVKDWRKSIINSSTVAVHIRRGDYLNPINIGKKNTVENNTYYLDAFKIMQKNLVNPTFCFFSDDLDWCRKTFGTILPNAEFVSNDTDQPDLFDLFAIAECDHGIMSPSTFSWWGNWLRNPESNSIVIYPEGDYADKFITNENWIQLSI